MNQSITTKFVKYIPDELLPNTLYVSLKFQTATHLCVCGCKNLVVTPLNPDGWKLDMVNEKATLSPSIGNTKFCPNKSHYFIRNGEVYFL